MTVDFKATGAELTVQQPTLASGSANLVRARFTTDSAWNGLVLTAVFRTPRGDFLMPLTDGQCRFPAEATAKSGSVLVGLFGTDGERTLTSVFCRVRLFSGTPVDGEEAENYTPGLYEQFAAKFARFENMTVTAERGADAAVTASDTGETFRLHFTLPKGDKGEKGEKGDSGKDGRDGADGKDGKDGADGKDGEKGADGYTPQRGTDYWTDADKNAIRSECKTDFDGAYVPRSTQSGIVYARIENKDTVMEYAAESAKPLSVVRRNGGGRIITADPVSDYNAATKKYVDAQTAALAPKKEVFAIYAQTSVPEETGTEEYYAKITFNDQAVGIPDFCERMYELFATSKGDVRAYDLPLCYMCDDYRFPAYTAVSCIRCAEEGDPGDIWTRTLHLSAVVHDGVIRLAFVYSQDAAGEPFVTDWHLASVTLQQGVTA